MAKSSRKYREFPYTPAHPTHSLPHHQPQEPQCCTFYNWWIYIDTVYNVNTSLSPKSLVHMKFHPGRCPLYGLGQMYNDLHYRITWSSLTAREISPCSTYPSLLPSQLLATTDLFTVIIVLPFPESHTAGIMPYGAFQTDCFHLVMDI